MEEQSNTEEQIKTDSVDNAAGENTKQADITVGKKSKKKDGEEPFSLKKEIFSWIRIVVIAVVIALIINNFIIINANVPTTSMVKTHFR